MPHAAALEYADSQLKVVLFSFGKKQPLLLERAFTVPFGGIAKDATGQGAREAATAARLKGQEKLLPCDGALLLPKQLCVARSIRLPSGDPVELEGMVAFEGDKLIPFNREAHITAFELGTLDAINGTEVLFAAVEDGVVRGATQVARAGGVEPIFAQVTSLSLAQSFLSLNPEEGGESPVILLAIGEVHTEITVIHQRRVATARAVMHGLQSLKALLEEGETPFAAIDPAVHGRLLGEMQRAGMPVPPSRSVSHDQLMRIDLTEPEALVFDTTGDEAIADTHAHAGVSNVVGAWLKKLSQHIRRTYEYAQRENGVPPAARIHVCGEGALLRGMNETLHREFGIEVLTFNPLARLAAAPGLPRHEIDQLTAYAPLHGAVVRLHAIAETGAEKVGGVNLLPADIIEHQRAQERKILLTMTGTLLLIAAILSYLFVYQLEQYQEEKARQLEASIRVMRPAVEQLEEKERKVGIIQRIRSDRAPAMLVLDLVSAYPVMGTTLEGGRVTLSDFKYTADQEVEIGGLALTLQDMNNFIAYLRGLEAGGRPLFVGVQPQTQSPISLPGREETVYSFSLRASFERPQRGRGGR